MVSLGRRRRQRRYILGLVMLLIVLVFSGAIYAADRVLRPVLLVIARNRVEGEGISMLTEVVNRAAAEPLHYSDLIEVKTTPDGYVSYMMPDTLRITRMVTSVGNEAQSRLNRLGEEDIGIPLGQLSGISILASFGPMIPVHVLPVGTTTVRVEEDFVSVGINHAKHTIFLDVSCRMQIAVPLIRDEIEVSVKMPIAEAIIVGPVPEMYLSMGLPLLPGGR